MCVCVRVCVRVCVCARVRSVLVTEHTCIQPISQIVSEIVCVYIIYIYHIEREKKMIKYYLP